MLSLSSVSFRSVELRATVIELRSCISGRVLFPHGAQGRSVRVAANDSSPGWKSVAHVGPTKQIMGFASARQIAEYAAKRAIYKGLEADEKPTRRPRLQIKGASP
jgi:hypothetical protein